MNRLSFLVQTFVNIYENRSKGNQLHVHVNGSLLNYKILLFKTIQCQNTGDVIWFGDVT